MLTRPTVRFLCSDYCGPNYWFCNAAKFTIFLNNKIYLFDLEDWFWKKASKSTSAGLLFCRLQMAIIIVPSSAGNNVLTFCKITRFPLHFLCCPPKILNPPFVVHFFPLRMNSKVSSFTFQVKLSVFYFTIIYKLFRSQKITTNRCRKNEIWHFLDYAACSFRGYV